MSGLSTKCASRQNQWATFGSVCTTDGTVSIVLADDGGDVYPAEVGADAIRAVRTNLGC